MKRKRIIIITLISIAVLILAAYAAMIFSGKVITVARCIVTEGGSVFMVHHGSPVRLNGADADGFFTGDLLLILRSGAIAQSYPGQAFPYFTVRFAKGDSSKIPQEVIEALESLGHHIMLSADTPPSVYTDLVITEIDTDHIVLSGIGCIADTYRVPNWFHPSIVPQVGDIVTVHHNGGERGEIYPAEFDKIYGMTLKISGRSDITVIPAMRGN